MHYQKFLLFVALIVSFSRLQAQTSAKDRLYLVFQEPYQKKAAFINHKGKIPFELPEKYTIKDWAYAQMYDYFQKGICLVYDKDKNYYALNRKGKIIHNFGKTIAKHTNGKVLHVIKNRRSALMDLNFKLLTDFKYRSIEDFSEGLAVAVDEDRRWVFLNEKGEEVVETAFNEPSRSSQRALFPKFKNGLVRFAQNGKIGYLNTKG